MLIQDVEKMITRHLSKQATQMYPNDLRKSEKRSFKSWYKSYDGSWVQGEVDESDQIDGRCVKVVPGKSISFGHWCREKMHGEIITIWADGKRVIDQFDHGSRVGHSTFIRLDGTKYNVEYAEDNMIDYD